MLKPYREGRLGDLPTEDCAYVQIQANAAVLLVPALVPVLH